jgi:hypothetical protein
MAAELPEYLRPLADPAQEVLLETRPPFVRLGPVPVIDHAADREADLEIGVDGLGEVRRQVG